MALPPVGNSGNHCIRFVLRSKLRKSFAGSIQHSRDGVVCAKDVTNMRAILWSGCVSLSKSPNPKQLWGPSSLLSCKYSALYPGVKRSCFMHSIKSHKVQDFRSILGGFPSLSLSLCKWLGWEREERIHHFDGETFWKMSTWKSKKKEINYD